MNVNVINVIKNYRVRAVRNKISDKVTALSTKAEEIKRPMVHACAKVSVAAQDSFCCCLLATCFYPPYCILFGTGFCIANVLTCGCCYIISEKHKHLDAAPFTLSTEEKEAIDSLLENLKQNEEVIIDGNDVIVKRLLEDALKNDKIVILHTFLEQVLAQFGQQMETIKTNTEMSRV